MTLTARYYAYLHALPCWRCGRIPVEVAHLRGTASERARDFLPRSHNGIAALCCIPLCSACHRTAMDALERVGEEAFFVGYPAGWRSALPLRYLAQWLMGGK